MKFQYRDKGFTNVRITNTSMKTICFSISTVADTAVSVDWYSTTDTTVTESMMESGDIREHTFNLGVGK